MRGWTHFVIGQCLGCKVVGARVETTLHQTGVESHEVLHLVYVSEELTRVSIPHRIERNDESVHHEGVRSLLKY